MDKSAMNLKYLLFIITKAEMSWTWSVSKNLQLSLIEFCIKNKQIKVTLCGGCTMCQVSMENFSSIVLPCQPQSCSPDYHTEALSRDLHAKALIARMWQTLLTFWEVAWTSIVISRPRKDQYSVLFFNYHTFLWHWHHFLKFEHRFF